VATLGNVGVEMVTALLTGSHVRSTVRKFVVAVKLRKLSKSREACWLLAGHLLAIATPVRMHEDMPCMKEIAMQERNCHA
jgi:hypothetical protein